MHLSARSELKSELADSRIETKLPIKDAGVLHACLGDVDDSHAGCPKMPITQQGPRCAAGAYDRADGDAGDHAYRSGSRMRSGDSAFCHLTGGFKGADYSHTDHAKVFVAVVVPAFARGRG